MNATRLNQIEEKDITKIKTGLVGLDNILGGGLATGTLTLFAGESGAGKSTIVLQISNNFAISGKRVLYFSCEESIDQIKHRANRLKALNNEIWISDKNTYGDIIATIEEVNPDLIIIDSLQRIKGTFGRLSQGSLKFQEMVLDALHTYINDEISDKIMIVINQFTKGGEFAGSNAIKHMADNLVIMKKNGASSRVVNIVKSRYGTDDTQMTVKMTADGLIDPAGTKVEIKKETETIKVESLTLRNQTIKDALTNDKMFNWAINNDIKNLYKKLYGKIESSTHEIEGFDIILKFKS